MGLWGVAFEGVAVVGQSIEVHRHLLSIVLVLALMGVLAKYLGLRGDLVFALEADAQAARVAGLVVVGQRGRVIAIL